MTQTYTPRPGSVADRAIAHLKRHGITATRPLADAIEAEHDFIAPSLSTAVKYGAVRRRVIDGLTCWSLGDGTPADEPDVDDDPIVQRIVEAGLAQPVEVAALVVAESSPDEKWPFPEAARINGETNSSVPAAESAIAETTSPDSETRRVVDAPGPLRIALWSDGSLQLQRGGVDVLVLSRMETEQLVDYLEQVLA